MIKPVVSYAKNKAPFAPIDFVRADFFETYNSEQLNSIEAALGAVALSAILRSQWLSRSVDPAKVKRAVEAGIDHHAALQGRISTLFHQALTSPKESTLWLAIPPNPEGWFLPSQIAGFASVRHEADPARTLLFRKPTTERGMGIIDGMYIRHKSQQRQIGVALLNLALSGFNDQNRVAMYIPTEDHELLQRLSRLSFETTGDTRQVDVVSGVPLREVRLEAPSVVGVRARLVQDDKNSWLGNFETKNKLFS